MSITKKLKSRKGLTLMEMLCVIVVLILLTSMMMVAVRLAMEVYNTTLAEAEARILNTTLTTAISDELRTGTVNSDGSYFSRIHGKNTTITTDSEGYVMLTGNTEKDMYLLPKKAYTHKCTADMSLDYSSSAEMYSINLKIVDYKGNVLINNDFKVKPLNISED